MHIIRASDLQNIQLQFLIFQLHAKQRDKNYLRTDVVTWCNITKL